MKSFIRMFVLSLAATGTVASAHSSYPGSGALTQPSTNAIPIPMCPPNDPNACHICDWVKCPPQS